MTYHISHNDLDGYGCQLLVNEVMNKNNDIKFFNVNYGKELQDILDRVPFILNNGDLLLITDLNLSEEQCAKLDLAAQNIGFKIHLWDHHISGAEHAKKYDWYYLDSTKCATAITLDMLKGMFIIANTKLNDLAFLINVYDMWQENEIQMNMAKSLNQVFHENKNSFPEELKDEERLFLFHIIKELSESFFYDDDIYDSEKRIYDMKINWFHTKDYNANMPLHILKIHFFYKLLIEKNTQLPFELNGLKGEVYFGLSNIFQEFSSIRLEKCSDIDFLVNINSKGYLSLRTKKENVDLTEIAKKYFFGGGHVKASGGSLLNSPKEYKKEEAFAQFMAQIGEQ